MTNEPQCKQKLQSWRVNVTFIYNRKSKSRHKSGYQKFDMSGLSALISPFPPSNTAANRPANGWFLFQICHKLAIEGMRGSIFCYFVSR